MTKATRLKAGRLVALAYLLCVLTPSATFAFGDGTQAAPCLTENEHGRGSAHIHEHDHAMSTHADGHDHTHSVHAADDHGVMGADEAVFVEAAAPQSDDDAGDHHKSGRQCCGLMCVSALPAVIAEFGQPAAPESIVVDAIYRNVADSAPPRLDRPPMS